VRVLATVAVAVVLAGCGGHGTRSPEDVVRAWSAALDRNDNDRAAALFAPNARVIQNGTITLATHDDAASWNATLPCGGIITSIAQRGGGEVVAVFDLSERPDHACDTPGQQAAAVFRVVHGKIVLWQQVDVTGAGAEAA